MTYDVEMALLRCQKCNGYMTDKTFENNNHKCVICKNSIFDIVNAEYAIHGIEIRGLRSTLETARDAILNNNAEIQKPYFERLINMTLEILDKCANRPVNIKEEI